MTFLEMAVRALEALDMGRPLDAKGYLRTIVSGMQRRWEYFVWLPSDPEKFLVDLEELGRGGWELVLRYDDTLIFKRQCREGL